MPDLTPAERDALYSEDRLMDAYYYSFDPTGQPAIDAILSAIAHAGKGHHHTESWRDDDEWSRWGEGRSVVDVIQAAANEAALALLDAAEERDALSATVERVREWCDRRGVDVSDRDDDYMRGYRAAQRHALLDAAELRRALDGETRP